MASYKVSWFYSLPIEKVEGMTTQEFRKHTEAMDRIEAQNLLTQFKVSDFPNMKDEARLKLHKATSKKAFPVQKVYSFDDIEKIFGA